MTSSSLLHPSVLPLDGGVNFRDLGGIRVADGRRVRHGKLLRSGALDQLSERDIDQLASMPVAHVVDYRDQDEAALRPDRLWSGARYHSVPANPLRHEVTASLETLGSAKLEAFDSRAFMLELYRRLPFGNPAYQHLVALLRQPDDGALVQHCAVGKDRTGIGSALVLFALGADEQTVMEDYLVTESTLISFRRQLREDLASSLSEKALKRFDFVLSAREEFLATALHTIREKHGSVDNWLAQDYGLDASAREELRVKYLV
ncbi:tyrosine-protein phosphatase [Dickeya dianthicola]|uniref:tyrosine-protein phosphatase n=1 Tax=Dickeya dianthicola TaxID=204039 RepID=UPI00136DA4CA|nr:tyrosine-protein phosphatase [Dickeya dianthicola]MCI4238482.1 tyrosine-protein phosphatase [Dickeya dianthicola]MCI4256372.1 tyrosine-protein phosphatase [Dickeya dianthicola]MZG20607.1 tyrosine-protein phosphatase [Dickeya dianthicola]